MPFGAALSGLLLVVCASLTAAGASEWRAGLASVKITPEEPVRMSGYGSRDQPSRGVVWDLYAKALAIEDKDGHRGVIVTTDLIGFRAAVAEPICEEISETTGLQRSQILLNSSHTHTGPTLSLEAESLSFPPDQARATVAYTRDLKTKIVELVEKSLGQLQPARLSRGTGVATFVMNRREFTERGVRLGFNPRGHVDRSVPVLRIDRPDGKLIGVLFGAACHNTTLTGKHLDISGDFAGYAQSKIEKQHPGALALFVQGCAGDANPFPRGSEEIARIHGRSLGQEVLRVLGGELAPVRGPLRTDFDHVALPLAPIPKGEELDRLAEEGSRWERSVASKAKEAIASGESLPTTYSAPIAVWQFGDDLTLVALSGEVVVDYVTLIEEALGPRKLWVAAYSNDVYGYLPSKKVLREGGYETRGLYAGGVGLFAPKAQDVLVEKIREMAEAVGRPREFAQPSP